MGFPLAKWGKFPNLKKNLIENCKQPILGAIETQAIGNSTLETLG